MITQILKEFSVAEPITKAWSYACDPIKVVECVPGAAITDKVDEQNYKGTVSATFGPVKASYNGTVNIAELDADQHKMKIIGKGLDSKGKGSADMAMNMELKSSPEGTLVKIVAEISIAGALAQFGSRLINDVTNQLFNKFVENFKNKLAGQQVDNTMSGASMMGTVLKSTLGGIFGGGDKK